MLLVPFLDPAGLCGRPPHPREIDCKSRISDYLGNYSAVSCSYTTTHLIFVPVYFLYALPCEPYFDDRLLVRDI